MKALVALFVIAAQVSLSAQTSMPYPVRRVQGKVVDLRELSAWLQATQKRGAKPGPKPSQFADWERVTGLVVSVVHDGLIVRELGSSPTYFIRNVPDWQLMREGQFVSLFAVRFGTYKHQAVGGVKTLSGYDHGEWLSAEELAEINRKAREALAHPVRRVQGKVVDLRWLSAWLQATQAPGAKPSPKPSQFADWDYIAGSVMSLVKDGLIVLDPVSSQSCFISNVPDWQLMRDGQSVSLFAVRCGTYKYQTLGEVKTLSSYDYGERLSAEELAEINRKAQAALADHLQVVKSTRDKQVAEANARAEKAREALKKQP